MSHIRHAARKDANATEIVNGLRAVGVLVYILDRPLDLLVGYRGTISLLELKDGAKPISRRRLREGQRQFMEQWAGYPIYKVESLVDAYRVLGIKIQ